MKIGISAVYYASGGSLTNLVQLLREWSRSGVLASHHVIVFASPAAEDALRQRLEQDVQDRLTFEILGSRGRGLFARLWAEQVLLPRRLRKRGVDVLFCPANVIPYRATTPTVVTFQNAAPFCESVTWRSLGHAGWWFRFRLLGLLIRASARRATRVIFISEWFRDLLSSRYRFPRERADVIHRGRPEGRRATPVLPPYLLYVSHLNPYKNVLEVIEAFASVDAPEWRLILAGRTNFPWYRAAIEERVHRLGLGARVELRGELDSHAVDELLQGAGAFVFASTCENCPTALIEALSCGLPIACSSVGVMPEIAGNAAQYFDPADVESMSGALLRVMTDAGLREELSLRARDRAAMFASEADVARRTLGVLERAAKERS